MRRALLLLAASGLCACSAVQNFSEMTKASLNQLEENGNSGGGGIKPVQGIGASENIPDDKRAYANRVERFLENFQRPGLKHGSAGFPVAWETSIPKMNTRGLLTGARTILVAKADVYGTYLEIHAYAPGADEMDKEKVPWIEKAKNHYDKKAKGESHRYAVSGNYLIYFPEAGPDNERLIALFQKSR